MNNYGKILAIAVLTNISIKSIIGKIDFYDYKNKSGKNIVKVKVDIKGKRDFHIDQSKNLTQECGNNCACFNPYGNVNILPDYKIRNDGDLDNITANKYGITEETFFNNHIKFKKKSIGRSVEKHQGEGIFRSGGAFRFAINCR